MKILLTFDVGTTSMKCCAFDGNLRLVAGTTIEYTLTTRGKHIVEADPALYWRGMCQGVQTLLNSGIRAADIACCGITTQGETTVVIDADGQPITPAIVWLDSRAHREAAYLLEKIGKKRFYETTGLTEISGVLPLAKLKWLMDDPNLREKAHKVLLLEDYLIYKLTGEIKTEQSLICSTGYYDITKHEYCEEFLHLAGAGKDLLPEVLPCGTVVGGVTAEASAICHIPTGTPVILTAMDQTASAIGAGNIQPGRVTETTGTCLTVAATVEKPDFTAAVPIVYYTHYDGKYLAMTYNTTSAIIVKWFRDAFIADTGDCRSSSLNPYDYMSTLADAVPPGAEGLFLLPHFTGKAMPNFSPDVRGCFYGVGLNTTRVHFIRAILEGVAYMLRENLECLEQAGIPTRDIRSLGGGARDGVWMGIKACVAGKNFTTMESEESTSLGAAILSACAIGIGESIPALVEKAVKPKATFSPDAQTAMLYDGLYRRYLNLDRAMTAFAAQASFV